VEENLRESMMPAFGQFIKTLSTVLESEAGPYNLWQLETLVFKAVMVMAVAALETMIDLAHGRGYSGCRRPCAGCGGEMKFVNHRQRSLLSSFGPLAYVRAYYYCQHCRQGEAPLDARLGLGQRTLTPRLHRLVSFHSGHLSFGVVEKTLKESHELELNREVVRQVAEESGAQALAWELAEEAREQQEALELRGAQRAPKTWIIEADGKKVGYQDGSWHEVKVGVIYELGQRVEVSAGRQELLKREIVARRGHWEDFARLFWTTMRRVGVRDGDRLVAVADGAESMEQIFAFVAPAATRVRDFYHVAEKIQAIGEVRFGTCTEACQQWASAQLHKLKQSETVSVVRSIAHLKLSTEEAVETRRQVLQYLEKNRYAMDYAGYQQAGWPLGSGAVEGGCRLIGARTNGCGRRWSDKGCDSIVALRVAVLNDRLHLLVPKPKLQQLAA
jgi:hypothetical protein